MANNFRNTPPKRTCTKSYASYRSYKSYLADDFNSRCGYTDCPDFWFGGKKTFHIDHFKPNDEGNYIDPCDIDYNTHFERDIDGSIIPISDEAHFMFKKLKLNMKRYQIIWMLDNIYIKMKKVKVLFDKEKNKELKASLLITQGELGNLLVEYLDYLTINQ